MNINISPVACPAYQKLKTHAQAFQDRNIANMFLQNPQRFAQFSILKGDILVDFSKNRIDENTLHYAEEFMAEIGLIKAIKAMEEGKKINETEERAVLHYALRSQRKSVLLKGRNIMPDIRQALAKVKLFADSIFEQRRTGYTGKPLRHVVNIGIGGSDLGPRMVVKALTPYHHPNIQSYFISNIDGFAIEQVLKNLPHEETLFIIASKTFTTQETLTNARTAKNWFLQQGGSQNDIAQHFVALSTNEVEVLKFGIPKESIFEFWNWVGGRFSLWSSIGLSIACVLGYQTFEELLEGAAEMDEHFFNSPLNKNIPVVLAFLSFWYSHFFGAQSEAIIPYSEAMSLLPAYLQQQGMESNGKGVDRNNNKVKYPTSSVLWGTAGTDAQHSFFQLLHQGTPLVPVDFILSAQPQSDLQHHQRILASHFFAQSKALMKGKTKAEVIAELTEKTQAQRNQVIPHKVFTGNRPSNTFLLKALTAKNLGSLIAMYEHKTFALGILLNVFSFDQWGVELGKQLSKGILENLETGNLQKGNHDNSTEGLIKQFLEWQ